ncbi:MAG: ribosome-recycling factor [Microcystis aeruginosa Ma_MB_S_20031200_S102]|uniref:Ribosome-recycling factor n=1 Tax=Microcystis aeruginosa Ma_MB_S_20031200_S102 TaxID=2486254 RepID=A0A552EBX9_MICAE|nr:MAG: ribosome-recycling factor [Microcystis aeruginosa Ma_MB_S_20031200_S102D]TRU31801.1 MAG: ribosome-recycling factor [Microcystis aeruginosa Ma_MB_S_20031200_S102]
MLSYPNQSDKNLQQSTNRYLDFPRINILAMAKSLTEPEFKQYNTNELLGTKS